MKKLDEYMVKYLSKSNKLVGGLADNSKDSDFKREELEEGIKIEREHTKDIKVAKEIAMDHLKEIPDYYTRLKKMEKKAEKEGVKKSLNSLIENLSKSVFVNKDTNTFTDTKDVSLSKMSTPEEYNNYIQSFVENLEQGVSVEIPLQDGKNLHIYKVEAGLFSGHIKEIDGTISHNISNVTIPEIITQLIVKNSEPLVVVETKKEEPREESKTPVIININISKSKESEMDTLDEKINKLCKAEDTNIEQEEETKVDPTKQDKVHPVKASLITDIIKLLQSHHLDSNDENVKDLAKFIVHLHKDTGVSEQDELGEQNQPADKNKKVTSPMKKSISSLIEDLKKSNVQVKRTKEENKMIFDHDLEQMIISEYRYCKKNNIDPEKDIMSELKKKVKARIIERMGYNDNFLLAQRDVKFDDKYLSEAIKKVDYKSIDEEIKKYSLLDHEPLYLSNEKYKILAEGGNSVAVLNVLEKGNNFFGKEITKPQIGGTFKEVDYEKLSKGRIEKTTDSLIKSRVDANIRK